MPEILPPEPKSIALVEAKKPVEMFFAGALDQILAEMRTEVMALPRDISTKKGRDAVASNAFKLAGLKNRIDERRKALVEDRKKEVREIDKEGGRIWDFIESVQKEFRQPLTDWENAEKVRIADHEAALVNLAAYGKLPGLHSVTDIESYIQQATELYGRKWEDFEARAAVAFSQVTVALNGQLATAKQVEADRAELARIKAERAEAERVEREARIAREATEKAERAAREHAEAETARLERDRVDAERRAQEAEARRIEAEQLAERRRVEAEAQAVRDREAAVEAERERVADEQRKAREAEEARERNRAHAAKINREVRDALVEHCHQISEAQAIGIIKAIVEGKIPHTKISY